MRVALGFPVVVDLLFEDLDLAFSREGQLVTSKLRKGSTRHTDLFLSSSRQFYDNSGCIGMVEPMHFDLLLQVADHS